MAYFKCLLLITFAISMDFSPKGAVTTADWLSRARRGLPLTFIGKSSVVKFIYGFGVPVEDLDYETVNAGIVFRTDYHLPSSPEDFRRPSTTNIHRRSLAVASNSTFNNPTAEGKQNSYSQRTGLEKLRWIVYEALESWASSFGYTGRPCLLKSICEAAQIPFHHENGVFGDLLHIIFTPSSSIDDSSILSDNVYMLAERLGRSDSSCENAFKECPRSILEKCSHVFDLSSDYTNNSI